MRRRSNPLPPSLTRPPATKPTAMLLVPSAWTNESKGQYFEGITAGVLKRQRYDVQQRIRFTGMELDLLATHQDTRQRAFVECKFTRDPLSANVIDVLIGKSIRRNADLAFLFSTSFPGKEAQGILDEMAEEPPPKFPHFAFIGPEKLAEIFCVLYAIDLVGHPVEALDVATLVLSPNLPPFWVLEEEAKGRPELPLRVRPCRSEPVLLIEDVQRLFRESGRFSGRVLEIQTEGSLYTKDQPSRARHFLLRRSGRIGKESLDALHEVGDDE